jgi:hypothetical protein
VARGPPVLDVLSKADYVCFMPYRRELLTYRVRYIFATDETVGRNVPRAIGIRTYIVCPSNAADTKGLSALLSPQLLASNSVPWDPSPSQLPSCRAS